VYRHRVPRRQGLGLHYTRWREIAITRSDDFDHLRAARAANFTMTLVESAKFG